MFKSLFLPTGKPNEVLIDWEAIGITDDDLQQTEDGRRDLELRAEAEKRLGRSLSEA